MDWVLSSTEQPYFESSGSYDEYLNYFGAAQVYYVDIDFYSHGKDDMLNLTFMDDKQMGIRPALWIDLKE